MMMEVPLSGTNPPAVENLSPAQLIEHIVSTHHNFLRGHLPQLAQQIDRVAQVHGPENPELLAAAGVFRTFCREMFAHMEKEEVILFPKIVGDLNGHPGCSLANILRVMEAEHEDAEDDLKQIRRLLSNYQLPAHACGTYRSMVEGLLVLEQDLKRHVYCENDLLFPKALASHRGG